MAHKVYTFTVPGKLYAYRRVKDHGGYKKYSEYKERVLQAAVEQTTWAGRVSSKEEYPITMLILIYWKKGRRIDGSNVLKGIEDALFEQDRFIDDGHFIVFPHTGEPERCEVILEHNMDPAHIKTKKRRKKPSPSSEEE